MQNEMNESLVTKNYLIAETPVLACFNKAENTLKPLVIFSHGFRGSKKDLKDKLEMLARRGYYAVAIDNRGHGD
jgi:alpha-beta hydrolase superfamily lysophospholipase